MEQSALFHRVKGTWSYAYDESTLHIRLRCRRGDIDRVELWAADPHDWRKTVQNGEVSWKWAAEPQEMIKTSHGKDHDYWESFWKPPYKRAKYFFVLFSGKKRWIFGEKAIQELPNDGSYPQGDFRNGFVFPYINAIDVYKAPQWVAKTIWYQIFPERFANGDKHNDPKHWHLGKVSNQERYGGDLKGITQKIDHIADLGCNGIYLTPIFESPSAHKYDTTDYMKIDPNFGTAQDLKALVDACHARGIRIVLDAVFNHCGKKFGPWLDVVQNGRDSKYLDWFHVHDFPLFPKGKDTGSTKDANFEGFAFTTDMPKLNTANPEVRDYLINVAVHYIQEYGIDGWRLDVANEIDHEFWRDFRKAVRKANPEAYIVGEIWHDATAWLGGEQYDAVMNYNTGFAIGDWLLHESWVATGEELGAMLADLEHIYPLTVQQNAFNMIDSHDTDRLLHRMGEDKELARLAWFLLMMMPGSPCIYYGTEYSMTGGQDPDNRRLMVWDAKHQDHQQYAFMKTLIGLRKKEADFFRDARHSYSGHSANPELFCVSMGLRGRTLLCYANRGATPISMGELGLKPGSRVLGSTHTDLVGDMIPAKGALLVEL